MNETSSAAARDQLVADLKAVVGDAEALLQATKGEVGERVDAVRARAEASLRAAKTRLSEVERSVADHAKEATKAADEYVREHPWTAVGIAAAVGVVVGVLLARK
jgi:ElaB/YqjD/DUF883 family membrane-anchored ribosome-binding protein